MGKIKSILNKLRWHFVCKKMKCYGGKDGLDFRGKIFGPEGISIGNGLAVQKGFYIETIRSYEGRVYEPELIIGDNFFARNNLRLTCAKKLKIGSNVTIAGDVFITDYSHGTNPTALNYRKTPLDVRPVEIGDGCWIGEKSIVLPGVSIGEKSIIGGGSVVSKSIPAYSIAVGNPCKVIKIWNKKTNRWEKP